MTITDPATGMPLSPGSERIVVSSSEAEVERVHLQTSAGVLSALFVAPTGPPRATIVALHGAGMTARYFHGRLLPGQSLMALAAQLGYNVLCVDRPGYGASAIEFSDGLLIDEQADVISDGVQHFLSSRSKGRGIVLVAHSFGGKIAMVMGARSGWCRTCWESRYRGADTGSPILDTPLSRRNATGGRFAYTHPTPSRRPRKSSLSRLHEN